MRVSSSGGVRTAAAALAAALLLAGCGSNDAPVPGRDDPAGAGSPAGPTLAELGPALAKVLAADGPVLCWLDEGDNWHADAYDTDFRKIVASADYTPLTQPLAQIAAKAQVEPDAVVVVDPCGGGTHPDLSPVSPDGKEIAVQVGDGISGHIGRLDVATGEFTDVSAAQEGDGYATEDVNQQDPGFTPDGTLWFRDNMEIASVDRTGRLTHHKIRTGCDAGWSGDDPYYFRPLGDDAVLCPVVHPSGRFAAWGDGSELDLRVITGKVDDADRIPGEPPYWMGLRTNSEDYATCLPLMWLSATELLCHDGGGTGPGGGFYTLRIDPGLARDDYDVLHTTNLAVSRVIAPKTDRGITAFGLSGDHRNLYLLGEDDVYRVDLTAAGSEPQKLGPAPDHHRATNLKDNFVAP
ncbi:hypothetical protein [Streptomyces smaragdinus]|nr:hypothetical protein [Streptomyces smaragdinus]